MPSFVDAHGIEIVYDREDPSGPARGIAHVMHGVGEHAGRYRALIDHLARDGWIVYADDHRGHGRTGMTQHGTADMLARLGPGGHRAAEDAVAQMTRIARDENPGLPLVAIGHSWGSFLAQIVQGRFPDLYDGAVLIGSSLRAPGSLNAGDLNARWKGPGATGMEWLSEDARVSREFLEDPLTTTTPLLKAFGPLNALRLFGRPRRGMRDVPVLLMVGRDDSVGGPRSVHRLADAYRRARFGDVTTHVYDGRHEILNGPNQERVRADLAGWLARRWPAG